MKWIKKDTVQSLLSLIIDSMDKGLKIDERIFSNFIDNIKVKKYYFDIIIITFTIDNKDYDVVKSSKDYELIYKYIHNNISWNE